MANGEAKRWLNLATPLGKDVLLLKSFRGSEEMSRPFEFELELVSEKTELAAKDIIGKPVTFTAELPDGEQRFFNGIVLRFASGHETWLPGQAEKVGRAYRAHVVPDFWLLKLHSDCRIFENKTVVQVVEQVLKDRAVASFKLQAKATYPELEYCVQYRETDYNFISRLLERFGLYYFFQHEDQKHTLIIGDKNTGFVDCLQSDVEFNSGWDLALPGQLDRWEHQIELVPGKYVQTDYNFEDSTTSLESSEKTAVKLTGLDDFELFDFPGGYAVKADGKALAIARMEQYEAAHDVVAGRSNCVSFHAGGKFKLKTHPIKAEQGKSFALVLVEHEAKEPSLYIAEPEGPNEQTGATFVEYRNHFRCVPADKVHRPLPAAPRPYIRGPQTAKVVGPKDAEVYTDEYGRIKVQFHWDRQAKGDEKSSCWMRVAQSWAGKQWGTMFLPRVGSEVMVEFLEGDPDRPIVTGSVYNDKHMPPWALTDNQTVSGIKTHSIDKGDAKTFNELRFDDKKDKELIYFHAQRDFERVVENDDKLKVGFDTKDKGDQIIDIYNDRTITIDKGVDTLQVKTKDRVVKIDKGDHLITVSKGDQTIKIEGGSHSLKVAKECTLDAGKQILLKVGTNSIKIDSKGITMVGMKVIVEGKIAADIKAMETKIKGTLSLKLEGGAMAELKGGLVKIN